MFVPFAEHVWKDNRQRIDAWMESAPEEHSQTLTSTSDPGSQRGRPLGLEDAPEGEPAADLEVPNNARLGRPKLSAFR